MLRILSVRIQNFRSIIDETIEFEDATVFIGRNDSGKSNVLKALNLFFNGETDFGSPFDFETDYCRFAKRGSKQAKEIIISIVIEIPSNYKEPGTKTWTKTWRANYRNAYNDNTDTLFNKGSRGFTLLNRTKYLYIPAVKSNEYFKSLLSQIYFTMTESANKTLSEMNTEYTAKIQEMTSSLSSQLMSILKMESAIQMPKNLNALFRDFSFITSDSCVREIDLNQRGDGIKARHIPSILWFMQQNTEEYKLKGAISSSFIWGFEEPENGIELFSCFGMADELFSYTSQCQIMLTTHSPVFYSKAKSQASQSKCYYVYKNNQGASTYSTNEDDAQIMDQIGLMPLLAPYIEKEKTRYQEHLASIERQKNDITSKYNSVAGKIIIIPEGKTDVKYLQCALSKSSIDATILEKIEFYDFQESRTLGKELEQLLKKLSCIKNTCKIIGMFDRDTNIYTTGILPYKDFGNNVYAFNIPALSSATRQESDKICIEHYFTDEEIKSETERGHIYLGKDFDCFGKSNDGDWFIPGFSSNPTMNGLRIIDGGYNKLEKLNEHARIIKKNDLADHIIINHDSYDFSNFEHIFAIIQMIVALPLVN